MKLQRTNYSLDVMCAILAVSAKAAIAHGSKAARRIARG